MANRTIVFATGNEHKVIELNKIMENSPYNFILPDKNFNPKECGKTFLENSYIKAKNAADVEQRDFDLFLADDSGLCVEALSGAPGIYSARYEETPEKRIEKLLKNMEKIENRNAYFICALTLCDRQGKILYQTEGKCMGQIAKMPSGKNGFGYDPIFMPNGYSGKTMADIDENIKNKISHRALALSNFLKDFR